jgi:hypothetical protein
MAAPSASRSFDDYIVISYISNKVHCVDWGIKSPRTSLRVRGPEAELTYAGSVLGITVPLPLKRKPERCRV